MKRYFVILLVGMFIIGCDAKPQEQVSAPKTNHVAQGFQYLNQKDIPRAIVSFDNAIKQDPTNVENYIVLGQVYLRLGNYQRSVDTLRAAVKVDPGSGQAYYLLATSRGFLKQYDEALDSAKKGADAFMRARDEENFKKSAVLVQSLMKQIEQEAAK